MKLKRLLIEQFDLTKKFIGEKNAKLAMIYKLNRKDQQREEMSEKKLPEVQKNLKQTIEKDEMEDEEEGAKKKDEEEEEDENLLTIDESIN